MATTFSEMKSVKNIFLFNKNVRRAISGSSNLDSFCDGWYVAVQLLLYGMLPPGFGILR